ncbi:MAG: hypothetical protein HC936_06995 [Leptolyngbyaceae cyanobacterium SU_3_3]|nr:hypothetical protein [Leptolyngbyaceae cyanobacterium SU_3_3]
MVLAPLGVKSLLKPLKPLGFGVQLMRLNTPLGLPRSPLQPPPLSPFLQAVLIDQNQESDSFEDFAWTPGNFSASEENQPSNLQEPAIAAKLLDATPAIDSIVRRHH